MELTVEMVNNTVRPLFERNVEFVKQFLKGDGADFGCGSCPLLNPPCLFYMDMSPQPLAVEQVEPIGGVFIHGRFENFFTTKQLDFIFSSHALEDLNNEKEVIDCLNLWSSFLKVDGYIVLLIPDMQGGRYPTVEEGGNCSHRINVGKSFFEEVIKKLPQFEIVQIDSIPHTSETMDIVLRKKNV
jgi:hypothetical protein